MDPSEDLARRIEAITYDTPGRVAYLVTKPAPGVHEAVPRTHVLKGVGFEGDHPRKSWWKGQEIPGREVTAIAMEVIGAMGLDPAATGDNLVTRGIDLAALKEGDTLRIGEVQLIRGAKSHRPCELFRQRAGDAAFAVAARGYRGALFVVRKGGRLAVNDPIEVIPA